MTPTERLLEAARAEVDARERLAAISAQIEACEHEERREPDVGWDGVPACRMNGDENPTPEWCAPCVRYRERRDAYRTAKRDLRVARSKMLTARRSEIADAIRRQEG